MLRWTPSSGMRGKHAKLGYVCSDVQLPIKRVGLEAEMMSRHLYFGLQTVGFDVVCMDARQVHAALSAKRNKTDKNDDLRCP